MGTLRILAKIWRTWSAPFAIFVFMSVNVPAPWPLVTVGCGSGTTQLRTIPLPVPDSTMGICAAGGNIGTIGAQALVEAAALALHRGCPREALMNAMAARDAPDAEITKAYATLLIIEARQQVFSTALVGLGQIQELSLSGHTDSDEQWITAADLANIDNMISIVTAGANNGAFQSIVGDSGRLMRLIVRMTEIVPCLPTRGLRTPEEIRRAGAAFVHDVLKNNIAFMLMDEIGAETTIAHDALWVCELDSAAKHFEEAATLLTSANRLNEALHARLSTWEARYIPGGRSGELGVASYPTDAQITTRAREIEAAAQNSGSGYQRGLQAVAELESVIGGARLDPEIEARVYWLRAVLALRLQGASSEASQYAARSRELAIKARRVDLLDGARLVGAIAAAELGRDADARQLLSDFFDSTHRRGSLGLRGATMAQRFENLSEELLLRGRADAALTLTSSIRSAARDLGFLATKWFHQPFIQVLEHVGRLEDALDATRQLAETLNSKQVAAGESRTSTLREVQQYDALLRLRLGDESALKELSHLNPEMAEADSRAIWALVEGDLSPLRDRLGRGDAVTLLSLANMLCAAKPRQLTQALRQLKAHAQQALHDGTADRAELKDAIISSAESAMKCGAALQDRHLFEAGFDLYAINGEPLDPYHEALKAEAEGDLAKAGERWEHLSRKAIFEIDKRSPLEIFRRSDWMLQRAAIASLASKPRDIAHAIALLNESRSRALRVTRVTQPTKLGLSRTRLSDVEYASMSANRRLRAISSLEKGADPASAAGLRMECERLERKIDALEQERDRIARSIARIDPLAFRAAALATPLSLAEAQARLADDEVIIYYLVDTLVAWAIVIDRHATHAIRLRALDEEMLPALSSALLGYRRIVRARSEGRGVTEIRDKASDSSHVPDPTALRAELYDRLVKPLETVVAQGKRILIVPDGETSSLPFAELGRSGSWWPDRNPLRILPGTYLLENPSRGHETKELALVVGDPDFGNSSKAASRSAAGAVWPRLPGARTEAMEIARSFGTTPLLDTEASEAEVKRRLPNATLVHLSTHAKAYPLRPSSSVILLAQPQGSDQDGLLHAYEIERMRLSARLVVLSACETGAGVSIGSEGALALDRAFLAAGAKTVVSSLWVVPDKATAALMAVFYRELGRGRTADIALAAAQRYVRSQAAWRDPVNWAAFRVIGAGDR